MASCICHVICAPMWRRLERLVRPLLPGTRAELAAAQPRTETLQLLGAADPRSGSTRRETTARACLQPHRDLSEADSAGRILRWVGPVRSRDAPGPVADTAHRA